MIINFLLILDILFLIVSIFKAKYFFILACTVFFLYLLSITLYYKNKNRYKNIFDKRFSIIIFLIIFIFLLIMLRLSYIQIFEKERFDSRLISQSRKYSTSIGERGSIFDITGKKLAFNKKEYNIIVDPSKLYDNNSELLNEIKEIYKANIIKFEDNILYKLENDYKNNKKYRIIARKVNESNKKAIEEIISNIYNGKLYKSHLTFEKKIERIYYRDNEYKNLIGMVAFNSYSDDKKIGIFGIEKQYEDYLVETTRKLLGIYDERRRNKLPLTKEKIDINLDGKNIYLTIDNGINYILNDELKNKFIEKNAEEAYGIVMEVNTGKILAVSTLSKKKNQALRNQIFQNQYEPGSIFKPIIVAAALEKKLITKNSTFNVGNGVIEKYGRKIRESSRSTKGVLSTKEIIMKSSNVGMALISDLFTEEEFENSLKDFGLYDKTHVDFPNEVKPYTISYKKWDKLKKSNMAFGQGIVVSPIQMITAFSSIVNGGKLYKPYLVDKIIDSDGIVIRKNTPQLVRQVISPENSKIMREIMEATVSNGTGKRAYIEGYSIGGKTGTAQISAKGGYLKNEYLSSFIGFFPADKPKYAVLCMFLKPQDEINTQRFGGVVAAPVVANVIKRIIKKEEIESNNIFKLKLDKTKLSDTNKNIIIENEDNIMPSLMNLSAKDILSIFKDSNIEIEISGEGLVYEQYPTAGTEINNLKKIKIKLK